MKRIALILILLLCVCFFAGCDYEPTVFSDEFEMSVFYAATSKEYWLTITHFNEEKENYGNSNFGKNEKICFDCRFDVDACCLHRYTWHNRRTKSLHKPLFARRFVHQRNRCTLWQIS